MIALLFALLTICFGLIWYDRQKIANFIFAVTIALGIYWLKFHATSTLSIEL